MEGLQGTADFQRFQVEAAYLTLIGNVVVAAIQEASLRAQIGATESLIKISKDILRIIRLQFQAGQVSGLDVAAQEALVAQTEATLPPLRKALYQERDALIVLSGHLPGEGLPERFEFTGFTLPRKLPMTIPLQEDNPPAIAPAGRVHCSLSDLATYAIFHMQGERDGGRGTTEGERKRDAG